MYRTVVPVQVLASLYSKVQYILYDSVDCSNVEHLNGLYIIDMPSIHAGGMVYFIFVISFFLQCNLQCTGPTGTVLLLLLLLSFCLWLQVFSHDFFLGL